MRYIMALLLTIVYFNVSAQTEIKELKVGDQVPGVLVPKIINSDKNSMKLNDFKDQLLILDFWNRGCKSCIEAMPHMDSLQKAFGNQVKILPVTSEPESEIRTFWSNNRYLKSTSLPTVVEDKILNVYFKHWGFPHEVWIYKGKVIGITGSEYVDDHNIKKVLSGEKVDWPVKNDFLEYVKGPLFALNAQQVDTNHTPVQYTAICGYMESPVVPGIFRDHKKKAVRNTLNNEGIRSLYWTTWSKFFKMGSKITPSVTYTPNQVLWEVGDRSKYDFKKGTGTYLPEWQRDHAISYESVKPDTGQTDKEIYRGMIEDLDALLGLKVRWKKRKEKVYTIVKKGIAKQTQTTGKAYMLSDVWRSLNNLENSPYVFMDEAKTPDKKVMLNIKSWTDLAAVKSALEMQGYTLLAEEKEVDKFVFTEIDGSLVVDGKMQIAAQVKRNAQINLGNPTEEESKTFLEVNKSKAGVVTLPSGLQYKILKTGKGAKPSINDKVNVHYQGTLVNGKIFDSSYDWGRPSVFHLKGVIAGLREALLLMPEGAKWEVYIPAELGYKGDSFSKVPDYSTLVFELELLNIVKQD